mmetsp:Transcript_91351/g.151320  ORF Transcript_91351/g.151320 Transcript_91351/m.151320 type:complete len:419 (-) Transcript_91351:38-1294(-)
MSRLFQCVPIDFCDILAVVRRMALASSEDHDMIAHQAEMDRGFLPDNTLRNLESAIVESGIISNWQPSEWSKVETLASAASGQGSVELMSSRSNSGQIVAVKKLPMKLMRRCPDEFNKKWHDDGERPWTDIAIVRHLNQHSCPFACQLLGVFLSTHKVYIMTSFANRGDLFSWCEADRSKVGAEREANMRPIVSQIFTAVCWLHDLGIAHCDLSLENLMLTDDNEGGLLVKIIDFGMATMSRSACRQVRGKRSYQAPEMHGKVEYDTFLADIFALGVVVYCMAVHNYPWKYTVPGKDRSCDMARTMGVECLLQQKCMQCCKRPIAEVFSRSYLDLLHGLLAFDPEARYSLGEACFDNISIPRANSKASLLSEISDASTTDSLNLAEDKTLYVEDQSDEKKSKDFQSRPSVWKCDWLLS